MTLDFSNGRSVSVCGFKEEGTNQIKVSEFDVFDCANGKSLTQFHAMQSCYIKTKKDTLVIKLLKMLPAGENWKLIPVQISEQLITLKNKELKVTNLQPILNTDFSINKKNQVEFITNLKNETVKDNIGKLEVLSLLGNIEAWNILEKLEINELDGSIYKQWEDAISNVKGIKNLN